MPEKSPRTFILIACACAIFWPGSFIFGLPGVLRQHWQQVFDADGGAVGGTVFFILINVDSLISAKPWRRNGCQCDARIN